MADVLLKCPVCQAMLDEEDLFCANCGTEAPTAHQGAADQSRTATHNFQCKGCGASMSYDASAGTLRCPFCGSTELNEQHDAKILSPEFVVPFTVDREAATTRMRGWLGDGFWRPGDLAARAAVVKMSAVFIPYWVFDANTYTYWTADTSNTPAGASGNWFPLFGEHRGNYQGLLIGGSSALTPAETGSLCPFDLSRGVPPEQVDLDNVIVEQFATSRKYARPLARQGLEGQESQSCHQYVPGNCRNLKVNVRIEGLTSRPALLPVWIMAYQYNNKIFRFLVNGQSGKATGQAPISYRKIAAAIAIGIAIVLVILLLVFGAAVMRASAPAGNPHVAAVVRLRTDVSFARVPENPRSHERGYEGSIQPATLAEQVVY